MHEITTPKSNGARTAAPATVATASLEETAPPVSSYVEGDPGERTYLAGVLDLAEMLCLIPEGDDDPRFTRQAHGVGVLLWIALAGLPCHTAARAVLRALARLGGELGATFARAAEVLCGLPEAWPRHVADMVVGQYFFGPRYKGDVHEDEDWPPAAEVVMQVTFTAYIRPDENDVASCVATLAHRVAAGLGEAGLGRDELRAFVELVYEEKERPGEAGACSSAPAMLDHAFLALVVDAPQLNITGADLRRSARTGGLDALIWAELRDLYMNRPAAARRLWRAIRAAKALPDDVVGPAADALADFPETWATSHAWAALTAEARGHDHHGIQGFARAGFDAPAEDVSPAESVIVWLVFMAYADAELDLDDAGAQRAFAGVVFDVVGLLADATQPGALRAVLAHLRSGS